MSMSKTGKKLKSIDCDNIDLTFNEIYDVFIDSEEYEFIIDDVGDKRYVYVHDKDCYELVDDVDLDKEIKLKYYQQLLLILLVIMA